MASDISASRRAAVTALAELFLPLMDQSDDSSAASSSPSFSPTTFSPSSPLSPSTHPSCPLLCSLLLIVESGSSASLQLPASACVHVSPRLSRTLATGESLGAEQRGGLMKPSEWAYELRATPRLSHCRCSAALASLPFKRKARRRRGLSHSHPQFTSFSK